MVKALESKEHRKIKTILEKKLNEWLKASIREYEISGHRSDIYSVTNDGITIVVEIIWSPKMVDKDIILLHEIQSDVKIVVVNPSIINNEKYNRGLQKLIAIQTKNRNIISKLIDGIRILKDPEFVDGELKDNIFKLIEKARNKNPPKLESPDGFGKIVWRLSYPHTLPLLYPPQMRFPITLAIRNMGQRPIFCKVIIESLNACLFFKPLQPFEVSRKKWLGLKSKKEKLWATLVDYRETALIPESWKNFSFHTIYIPGRFDLALAKQLELRYSFHFQDQITKEKAFLGPHAEYIDLYFPSTNWRSQFFNQR